MAGTGIPPQAYTTETLHRAYKWLITQPESVRSKGKDPDSIVRMYLHALKYGDPQPEPQEAKVDSTFLGSKEFKAELQDLARGLSQFEDAQKLEKTPTPTVSPVMPPSPPPPRVHTPAAQVSNPVHTPPSQVASEMGQLHPKAMLTVRRVQERFALSSEWDAVNLLIIVGAERLANQLPEFP